ncbi:MAG TPA: hypothetical protein PK299_12780, partial [Anaerolineales bacterium]|nr:hypothetical protein [Anaerolineales bacterium]
MLNNNFSRWGCLATILAAIISGIFLLVNTFIQNKFLFNPDRNFPTGTTQSANPSATTNKLESAEIAATVAALAQPTLDALNLAATINAQVVLTTAALADANNNELLVLATAQAIESGAQAEVNANLTLQAVSVRATKTIASLPTLAPTIEFDTSQYLNVGETWIQGDWEVDMSTPSIHADHFWTWFQLTSRKRQTIAIAYSQSEITAFDNNGTSLDISCIIYGNGCSNEKQEIIIAPDEQFQISSIEIYAKLSDPTVTEILVTISGLP